MHLTLTLHINAYNYIHNVHVHDQHKRYCMSTCMQHMNVMGTGKYHFI